MTAPIQRSFTAGEIAPSLRSRADLVKYATGLAHCENFIVQAQGGVCSRPGTRFIGELDDSSKRARLIPFSFNTEQTYILVFEHLKMYVIKDGGYVLNGAGPALFSLVTPYTESQLSRLNFTQSADVMTIVHPDHDPRNLSRTAHDNWTLTIIDYSSTVDPPIWTNLTVKDISTITQANPAVVTTTAAHGFTGNYVVNLADIVGMTELNDRSFVITNVTSTTFELLAEDSTGYTAYSSGGTATKVTLATVGSGPGTYSKVYMYVVTSVDENGIESLPGLRARISTTSLSTTWGVRLQWELVPGATHYRVYKDLSNNSLTHGWIGDSKTSYFDDYNVAPISSDAPPEDRQPFSGADDKPSAVNYYQQRQIYGNTGNEPQVVYTTQTADYASLRTSTPAKDDDAVTFTVVASQVNEIRHIVSLDSLILLTSGGAWLVSEGQDNVLTPSTVGVRIQSYSGSSWVPPVIAGDTVIYVGSKGGQLRNLGYQFAVDKYTGEDLSLLSDHLFRNETIEEIAYAESPYGVVWCIRSDGVLLGLTYQREHEVVGWHQHTTLGEYESVASIIEGDRDAVYFIVKREVNGSVVRFVERMEPRYSTGVADTFYVDSGLSLDDPSIISGATQADPVVITDAAHGYSNGDLIDVEDIAGMTELNDARYKVANKTTNTYELTDESDVDIDSTAFTAYDSGGESRQAVTIITGLDHLEGEPVAVLADGAVIEGLSVTSGTVTLSRAASKVHVGLTYLPAMELLDIDIPSTGETLKSDNVSVGKVTLEVEDSKGGWVGAKGDDGSVSMVEIKPRFDADVYGVVPLKTFKQEVTVAPEWNKGGGVRIEQRSPLPLSVLSVIPAWSVGGR